MRTVAARGFTLIELMIALSIFAFLVMVAGPQYADFMGNMQIRNGAENTLTGVRLAQTEAVRTNRQGKFVLDPTPGTGGWKVWRYDEGDGSSGFCPASGTPQWCLVQSYDWTDGATKTTATPTPVAATTVLFNGLGQIVTNDKALVAPDGTASITQIDVTNSNVAATNRRPLRIVVSAAGGTSGTKLCDPGVTDALDPRVCPS
jgi:type IV fimbrial biogenesis protein FimT